MSSYENYDTTAAHYDRTRWPIGAEIIVDCLAQGRVPLAEGTLLDAGCGTGNYARALLPHVRRIEALDRSAAMLAIAGRKLAAAVADGRVVLHRGEIDALPFPDASVDGVMINQVLHHLPDAPEAGWPAHRRVLGESARVLRPGGVLVINTCSHAQTEQGFWPFHLIPRARAEILRRLMPLDALAAALDDCGIGPRGRFVPVDALVQGEDYLDPRGPLRAEWRAGDSIWALVNAAELAEVERKLRDLDARGELAAYMRRHDAMRLQIGQITFVYGGQALKAPSSTSAASARIAPASGRSVVRNAACVRTLASAASSGALLSRGRRSSMPCAAASSSIATMCAALSAISSRRRAACVAMLTWSSWFAEVGRLSIAAGWARC
jgi:SAM-dependent methyltransferase